MKTPFLTRLGRAHFSVGAALACAAVLSQLASGADAPSPVKLALFDFELEDASAGASLAGESPADIALLQQITGDARRLVAASGRYSLVDIAAADAEAVKGRWLRKCGGCDAGIAASLGAEQSFIGVVTRISRMEYTLQLQISDARTGTVVFNGESGLRMGADYSWGRGVASLLKSRLLDRQDQQ